VGRPLKRELQARACELQAGAEARRRREQEDGKTGKV
jgi:hypothetical protein